MYEMFVMLRIRNRRFLQIIRFFIKYLITHLTQLFIFYTPRKILENQSFLIRFFITYLITHLTQ